jgi:hypothetical protein
MTTERFGTFLRISALSVLSSTVFFTGCAGGGGSASGSTSGTGTGGTTTTPLTVTAVSPTDVLIGSPAITLAVKGTGFTSSSVVSLNGTAEPTTFVSTTEVDASVAAGQLTTGQILSVSVANGSISVTADPSTAALSVDNPVPSITGVTPATVLLGSTAASIVVAGTSFVPGVSLSVNGSPRTTTYVSSTQLTAALTAADFSSAQVLPLNVINPKPGGGTSGTSSIGVNNPKPAISSFSPASLTVGGAATVVMINGSGFLPSTVLQINGATRAVTYVSPSQLTVGLTATDLATVGSLAVTTQNPQPGGGASAAAIFPVTAKNQSTPVITSVSPTSFLVGAGNSTLSVSGTSLVSTSQVQWNGTALTTSLYTINGGGSYLYAQVPASLLSTVGTASITVSTPGAAAASNALTVSITNPPAPTLSSVSPSSAAIGSDVKVTINGTGYTASSVINYNGKALTTTYNSSTSLSATLPAAQNAVPGIGGFTVTTPAPGGGTSASVGFTSYIGLVNNSMVYNPVDGLLYLSIPGSVGAPLGNSVVSMDPATGTIGTPIPVGSEPNKLALTADGKYLWVGLDGASAVRKVDLVNKIAGLQFSLNAGNSGIYNSPATVLSLAAVPGMTDGVLVSSSLGTFGSQTLTMFNAGAVVATYTGSTNGFGNPFYALTIDGSKNEIYGGGASFATFNYTPTSITAKATNTNISPASYSYDEMQVLSGRIYTDIGKVLDAESGAVLGSYYSSGTTVAQGPQVTDANAGKTFMLNASAYSSTNQVLAFNTSDFTATGESLPLGLPPTTATTYGNVSSMDALVRWGANGLAFRTTGGVASFQWKAVKDLSSTNADLGVSVSTNGSVLTGGTTSFVATVNNAGPSAATDVVLSLVPPSSGVVTAITPSVGTCYNTSLPSCSLGTIANGTNVKVTVSVQQLSAGTSTLGASVGGSTTDTNAANNSATASATITGNSFSPLPAVSAISPSAIVTGSSDTVITLSGSGFSSSSVVMMGSTTLNTTVVSSTSITAIVPAANLTAIGWQPISVTTPAPGGGASTALPLTVYKVITLGANHILYDPYSRMVVTSVGSGSSSVTGNSIATIDPTTGNIGTPVSIGSQPTNMSLTSDGQILYTILSGNQSIARFNMLTQQLDFTYTVPTNSSFVGGIALRGIAAQPGTENTVALDIASFTGNAIYDFDPNTKTAAIRGQASGPYSGSCLAFYDATNMLAFDIDTSGFTLDHYTVTNAGFTYYDYTQYTESTLNHFGCFKLDSKLAFANGGGIADPTTVPATPIAVLPNVTLGGGYSNSQAFTSDWALKRAYYPAATTTYGQVTGLQSYDLSTFLPSSSIALNMAATEGSTSYTPVDVVRWGQDGLAILTSTGHIYLLRGAFVAPQLLNTGAAAAVLTSASSSTVTHGAGNTLLTLTGTGFLPGVAVTWNGAYRTTTLVDTMHVTVAIPASDLAAAGSGSLVATNPGGSASGALTITVQ